MTNTFTPSSVEFSDGAVWTYATPPPITYEGPRGSTSWTWATTIEASAAWLAVCTH
jgi:hypothetical protein